MFNAKGGHAMTRSRDRVMKWAHAPIAKLLWSASSVRLYFKVLGIALIIASLFCVVTLYLVHHAVSSELQAELSERAEALLNLAAQETQAALDSSGTPGLRDRLAELLVNMPDGALIVVDDGADFTVRVVDPGLVGAVQRVPSQGDEALLLFRSRSLERTQAVVTVGVSTARMEEKLHSAMASVGLWLLVCITLVTALVLGLTYLIVRPIRELVRATTSLREGEYATRATVHSGDEIGCLAQAFNELADNLQSRQQEVVDKEAERVSLIQHMIHSQEAERKVLARNLHDEIGQTISHLLMEMQGGCHKCLNGPPLAEGLRNLIDEARRLAWDFRPSILDDYGLEIAIRRYAEERCAPLNIRVDCEWADVSSTNGQNHRLPGEVEVTLYRIAQEAITNIIRHADARHASVVVLRNGAEVTLIIEDDGCGFDPDGLVDRDARPLGLMGMRERTQLLGGEMMIDSKPGSGTTVRVSLTCQRVHA
jgi:signal transduction histidine kinase